MVAVRNTLPRKIQDRNGTLVLSRNITLLVSQNTDPSMHGLYLSYS